MSDNVVVKNEIIVPRGPDNYMEIRHLVLEGSNRQIGMALGDIAQDSYGVSRLMPYASPIYARAHHEYMEQNYPMLLDRMRGVAESYGLSDEDLSSNTSDLIYCMGPLGCSTVYIPGAFTATGRPLAGRTTDFYTARFSEFVGLGSDPKSPYMYSQSFVIERYPDEGHASLVLGGLDLLSGITDGMNSQGLAVVFLADNNATSVATRDLTKPAGLSDEQLAHLLLETCATVEEAKVAVLRNKFYMQFDGSHLMVSDARGDSTIVELSEKDYSIQFTDNDGKSQVMTNHSAWEYADESTFPEIPAGARYNSFYRYKVLSDYIASYQGEFSSDDVAYAMSLVYANTTDSSEGAAFDLPVRTLWLAVFDHSERSIMAKFYLRDGPGESPAGGPELLFTEPIEFKLHTGQPGS